MKTSIDLINYSLNTHRFTVCSSIALKRITDVWKKYLLKGAKENNTCSQKQSLLSAEPVHGDLSTQTETEFSQR